jgi:serine/threonine-protein kinase
LAAFLAGTLGPDEPAEIERHLADCDACATALETLREGSLVTVLRRVAAPCPEGEEVLGPAEGGGSTGDGDERDPAVPGRTAQVVSGYEILGELGRGAMGVVYKARQVDLRRVVALKMILAGLDPRELARFRREAEALAGLQHPNLVAIYAVGEQDGRPYFSMEYVADGSLAERLDGTPMPVLQAARFVEILCGAVQEAHRRGIVHRDLKPANVLLTTDGTPKISDFGLAKRMDDPAGLTSSGAVLGTPGYMAPEQAAGEAREVGPAADIHALGAILYELLTGRPPFRAATPLETVQQVISEEATPPRLLVPRIPRDLETICLKCLHKDPGRRYPDAAALAEDLRSFVAGEPIRGRPPGLLEELDLLVSRRPLLGIISYVIVVGAALNVLVLALSAISAPGGLVALPAALAFGTVLLGLIRPSRMNLIIGSALVIGGMIVCLMVGGSRDAWTCLELLVFEAWFAACIGLGARAPSRFCGRPIWETLPGSVVGTFCWYIGPPLLASTQMDSVWWSWWPMWKTVMLGGMPMSSIVGGLIPGALFAWCDSRRSGRTNGRGLSSRPRDGMSSRSPATPTTATWPPPGPSAILDGPSTCPHPAAVGVPEPSPSEGEGQVPGRPRVPGYEILGELGRGGMGAVYKARQIGTDRLVALKVIRAGQYAGEADRERFGREARAVARLVHPNVVQVYAMGDCDGQPYFVLEYVAGGTLADRLHGRPWPARDAAQLVRTLAHALQTAHRQGIIHRDLKPRNVLLTPDGQPKIADFGLARLMDEPAGLTASGAVIGTPSYMAPEQAAGEAREVGPAADIHALGAILYELLTGRPPFRAPTIPATLSLVLSSEPVSPRLRNSRVPRDLEAICLRCLEKRPHRRYATATELAVDLGRFLAGEPPVARRLAWWKRLVTPRRQHADGLGEVFPTAALLVLLIVGILVCLLSIVAMGARSPAVAALFVFAVFLGLISILLWWERRKPVGPYSLPMAPSDQPIEPHADGWITVPLAYLRFPPECSRCGVPTSEQMPFRVPALTHRLELNVPVCSGCRRRYRRRRRIGNLVGLLLGLGGMFAVELAVIVILEVWSPGPGPAVDLMMIPILLTPAGAALGAYVMGSAISLELPVRLGRYAPRRGIVGLRFLRPEYAVRFIGLMQADARDRNDLHIRLALTPEQATRGTEARVVVHRVVRCPYCQVERDRLASCPTCANSRNSWAGRLLGPRPTSCPVCGGARNLECRRCDGTGSLFIAKDLTVSVPAGITTGALLRLPGQGNEGPRGTLAGDLLIRIEVR